MEEKTYVSYDEMEKGEFPLFDRDSGLERKVLMI